MSREQELKSALRELAQVTGLTLQIPADTEEEIVFALSQVRQLSLAYQEKYNKNYFLRQLMQGAVSFEDIRPRARKLRIDPDCRRLLFLVQTRHNAPDILTDILQNLFPAGSRHYIIQMDERHIAVLKKCQAKETEEDALQIARMIIDTIQGEGMISVHVSYGSILNSLTDLSTAFSEARLAMEIGAIFYSDQLIVPYNQLGIGHLIYHLPLKLCEDFLHEIYGREIPSSLESEIQVTINKFFQNNLNIAETSRQLHMHRNTLIYRLEQIQKSTGLDIRNFEDALTFRIASMIINYLQTKRMNPDE